MSFTLVTVRKTASIFTIHQICIILHLHTLSKLLFKSTLKRTFLSENWIQIFSLFLLPKWQILNFFAYSYYNISQPINVVYKSGSEKVWYCSWINRLPIFKLDMYLYWCLFRKKRELCNQIIYPSSSTLTGSLLDNAHN